MHPLDMKRIEGYDISCTLWLSAHLKIILEHEGLKCPFKNFHNHIEPKFQNIVNNFFRL